MSPIFFMLIAAIAAVVAWAMLDRRALGRRVEKLRADEKVYREELTAFSAKKATKRIKDDLDTFERLQPDDKQTATMMSAIFGDRSGPVFFGGGSDLLGFKDMMREPRPAVYFHSYSLIDPHFDRGTILGVLKESGITHVMGKTEYGAKPTKGRMKAK